MARAVRPDGGSVLILMPVALLVTLLLGAIAVDAAQQFEAQRQAVADAQALANDAASALSGSALRATRSGARPGPPAPRTDAGLDPGAGPRAGFGPTWPVVRSAATSPGRCRPGR